MFSSQARTYAYSISFSNKTVNFYSLSSYSIRNASTENRQGISMKNKTTSEDNDVRGFLTYYDFSRCIVSIRYQICLDMNPTEAWIESSLATLYFKNTVEALETYETEQVILPSKEKANNLGDRAWINISITTAYTLSEFDTDSTTSSRSTKYPGCRIFMTTLK